MSGPTANPLFRESRQPGQPFTHSEQPDLTTPDERCVRRIQTSAGSLRCRDDGDVVYLVDPEGGLSEKPPAYLCRKHDKTSIPLGYIRRPVQR